MPYNVDSVLTDPAMASVPVPPFSSRNRGPHTQVDNDFPESARTALLHLLFHFVDEQYMDWLSLVREIERIARAKPTSYDYQDIVRARRVVDETLVQLPWEKVFDFCERLYSYMAQEVSYWDPNDQEPVVTVSRPEVQSRIRAELVRLFQEEHLAFEFSEGVVRRRGRRHTTETTSRAELVLGDPRLAAAREHFNKALRYFRNVSNRDHENVVKEAVCSVEATARALFPAGGPTLGDVVKSITGAEVGQLPKPIAQTFHGLYGFRSGGDGVGHGGGGAGAATAELAEYALALAASQIMLLVDLANTHGNEVPF
jgi:hypothetical protein